MIHVSCFPQAKTKAKLLKTDNNGKLALTTAFKEALADIFVMSDLDGNGALSKQEFALYNMRTSGEELEDELWEVVASMCELKVSTYLIQWLVSFFWDEDFCCNLGW